MKPFGALYITPASVLGYMHFFILPKYKSFIIFKNKIYFLVLYYTPLCYNILPLTFLNIHLYLSIGILELNNLKQFILFKFYQYYMMYADYARPFKLCFKRKGGWLQARNVWPYILIYKFGYSHPVRWLLGNITIKLYKKYLSYHNLLVAGNLYCTLNYMGSFIRGVRVISSYSRRGIKYGRQLFIKRRGKDSQYAKFKSKIF